MTRKPLLLPIFLLLLGALPLTAQEPRFFIERIEVRNNRRVTPDVIIAESRLREGHEYSEAELRDASTRLERLPFLLSVDFALEKGTERGQHVLVLTVNETKPFFIFIDARPFFESGDDYLEIDYTDRFGNEGNSMALGFRWFVGRRGALHVGLVGNEDDEREFTSRPSGLAVGYTQYDIFGTRAFATLNLVQPIEANGESRLVPQLVVGIPVSANQTVTLQYDETRRASDRTIILFPDDQTIHFESSSSQRVLSARWSYNTTNEPYLPTRGTLLQVTPFVARLSSRSSAVPNPNFPMPVTRYRATPYGIEASAAHFWEISDRNSVFGEVRGGWESIDEVMDDVVFRPERTAKYGSMGVGISRSLWSRERRANGGDSRIDLTLRYANRSRPESARPPQFEYPGRDVRQLSTSWIRRTSWGTFRIGAGYAW